MLRCLTVIKTVIEVAAAAFVLYITIQNERKKTLDNKRRIEYNYKR